MKYLVKNKKTGEETLCEKVVVDNHDYYVNDIEILFGEYYIYCNQISRRIRQNPRAEYPYPEYKKVIATNNKSLDLPQVVDEVEVITEELCTIKGNQNNTIDLNAFANGVIQGYQKSKETYQFTKEDMVEFAQWFWIENIPEKAELYFGFTNQDMFLMWQEQRIIKIDVKECKM